MSERLIWAAVALLVASTLWLLVGAVSTVMGRAVPAGGPTSTSWFYGDGDLTEVTP